MSICPMCGGPLVIARQKKKFCSPVCLKDFHEGCRKLSVKLLSEGKVTFDQIKAAAH